MIYICHKYTYKIVAKKKDYVEKGSEASHLRAFRVTKEVFSRRKSGQKKEYAT